MRFREFLDQQSDRLEISIVSQRENGNLVSTVMRHRGKKNGRWKGDLDLDSGEQGSVREIPGLVQHLLQSFGRQL